jgi:thioredoxin reductase
VVGGGNSAGQAVVRFSRYARQVTLLVRGRDLGTSMSQYLIDQLSGIPNFDVRVRAQVVSLEADDRLRALVVRSGDSAEPVRLPAAALFICIGMPRTDGPAGIGLATNAAGYLVTGGDGAADRGARDLYDRGSRARRPPLLPRRHQATDEGSAACSQFGPHGRLPRRNR